MSYRLLSFLLGGLLASSAACSSSPSTYYDSASLLAEDLLTQLEQRTDLRNVRLLVAQFQPCERASDGQIIPIYNPMMAARHRLSAMRIRHEIMGVLAPRLPVIEPDDNDPTRSTSVTDLLNEAKELGATAVLSGNFTMEGDHVLVLLRVVSADDRVILAAAEGLVPHAQTPMPSMSPQ